MFFRIRIVSIKRHNLLLLQLKLLLYPLFFVMLSMSTGVGKSALQFYPDELEISISSDITSCLREARGVLARVF